MHFVCLYLQALTDGLNYGFYLPPSNGKAGKFLEEERLFSDYPTDAANMPFLEVNLHRLLKNKYQFVPLEIEINSFRKAVVHI